MRELEAKDSSKELEDVKLALTKSEAELLHAKQNLVNYINSLNELEDKIKAKVEGNEEISANDEVARLRLENMRLNEENSSLVNARQMVEREYISRIEDMNKKLFAKGEEHEELQVKYTHLLKTLNEKREEEIKAWLRREGTIREAIEELRRENVELREKREAALLAKDEANKATLEEVKLLRQKLKQHTADMHTEMESWMASERELKQQVHGLREHIRNIEDFYKKVTALKEEEF